MSVLIPEQDCATGWDRVGVFGIKKNKITKVLLKLRVERGVSASELFIRRSTLPVLFTVTVFNKTGDFLH